MAPSPEQRNLAHELFLDMVESGDPDAVLMRESDGQIRSEAMRLWLLHLEAERNGFLSDSPTLVRGLHDEPGQTRTWEPGTRLSGRFVVLEFLGEGGMGEVYLAYDERLHDRVALKTVRRELLDEPELRGRLTAEVQNARQVTHPNVCRIFDIYDDGEATFFAMEYLQGQTLAAALDSTGLTRRQARAVALQLAEALRAAHDRQILHRDFKPGNVILTRIDPNPCAVVTDFGLARALDESDTRNIHSLGAGTPAYMAPEVLAGAPATIQSDLYAYGKVLSLLVPGHPLVHRLTAPDPRARPDSIAFVIERLTGNGPVARWTRRAWVFAATLGAGAVAYRSWNAPHVPLGTRQRVILNALRGAVEPAYMLNALHKLLQLALQQSPLLNVFPEATLRAALRKRSLPADLPARLEDLLQVGGPEGARLIVDGEVRRAGAGLDLFLDLFVDSERTARHRIRASVADTRQLTRLAETTALQLRKECGESAGAIRNSYSPLERATSAVPEAVQYYFEAIQLYERMKVEEALALLDKAIELDPEFALAIYYRGLMLSGLYRWAPGFESCERAFQLRHRTTPRERASIESQYYNLAGDRLRALEAYKQNAFLFPDDAIFQRQLAYGYARLGQFDEALRCSRRAVDLDPFSIHNRSELVVNLVEAMRYDDALAAHQEYLAQGLRDPVPNWGAGLARIGKGEYAEAQRLFDALGAVPQHSRWARQLKTIVPILEGDLAAAAFQLQGDVTNYGAAGDEFRALDCGVWLGWTALFRDRFDAALSAAREIIASRPAPPFIFAWRGAGQIAAACGDRNAFRAAADTLRRISERYPSAYLSAAIAGMEADWAMQSGDLAAAEKLVIDAVGLFPDVQNLFTAAHYFRARADWNSELRHLNQLAASHGRILKHEWPGWIPLHRFEMARCLIGLGRAAEARPHLNLLEQSWGRRLGGARIGSAIRALSAHARLNSR